MSDPTSAAPAPGGSIYAAQPWLALLSDAQRAPVTPPATVLHSFRDAVRRAPEHPALAYFDGRLSYRETDGLSDSVAGHLAARGCAGATGSRSCSRTARTSSSRCSAPGRRARPSSPSTRCTSPARSATSSRTPGSPR